MAQLSRLAKLFVKISDNLTEDEVRNLRALLAIDEVLGKAKVENATPLEIFNMLGDNKIVSKGNLGFLVEVLRSLGKGKLAEEAERLEQKHRKEEDAGSVPRSHLPELSRQEVSRPEDIEPDDSRPEENEEENREPEDTEVKGTVLAVKPTGASTSPWPVRKSQDISDPGEPDDSDSEDSEHEYFTPKSTSPEDSASEDTEVKEIIPVFERAGLSASSDILVTNTWSDTSSDPREPKGSGPEDSTANSAPDDSGAEETEEKGNVADNQDTTEESDDTDMQQETSELASLHIKELDQLLYEPKERAPTSATDERDAKMKLVNLQADLDRAAVIEDKAQQFDQCCQIGDLYRTKLHNLQVALQYYQNMLECSKALTGEQKQAKAYNRLGLTYDILGMHKEAVSSHKRALEIYKSASNNETEICVAYKNLASSLALSGEASDAKTHYNLALTDAIETENKAEQMDVYCKLGDLHMEQLNEPQVSCEYFTHMLALARDIGSTFIEGEAYSGLGLACAHMQHYEAALEWHLKDLQVKQVREDGGDKREQIITYINVGNAYRTLGKLDQAKSHFNTALQMAQQTEYQYGQMHVKVFLGDLQREQLHSPRTALQYYEQYLALARQLGDRRLEGEAYNRLGLAHYDMGKYGTALELCEKYLKITQERDDKKEAIDAHATVGNAFRSLEKIKQAKSHFDTALQLAQQTGDLHGQMVVYFPMGDLQREQLHSPRAAVQYYEQALALARQLGDKYNEGVAYNRLGLAHYEMGENGTALEWYQTDLKIRQETGDKADQLVTHNCMAASYQALGKLDQAKSHYESAMTIAMETGNKQEQMDINLGLGDLHREQLHEPQVSHQYYAMTLTLARDLENKGKERLAYNRLGSVHYEIGEYAAALDWDKKYLKMSQENGDKTEQIAAHQCVGHSYQSLGKLDQARSHYESAMTLAMETGNKQEQEDIAKRLKGLKTCIVS